MEFDDLDALRIRNLSWRLLTRDNAPLILAFLGRHFADENRGPTGAAVLASRLGGLLDAVNSESDEARFPRRPLEYLDEWSAPENGWLRRFYPVGSDEVHYDATSAFQRAYTWVSRLTAQSFVGTESRLQLVVDLLRQIVHGAETDPDLRLAELRRRRDQLDRQIADVEAGRIEVLTPTQLRERYQQFAATARELLADFREVEENFRGLDRATRERIASWDGSKGEVLAQVVGSRSAISDSDQGRTFQAFYDFLLSERQQDELSTLIREIDDIREIDADSGLRTIHRDWSEAAERTQLSVRQISEQLRRFLDDRAWAESRRLFELIRSIETMALKVRGTPPLVGFDLDGPGLDIVLPVERPLFDARPTAEVDDAIDDDPIEDLDAGALFDQVFVDQLRLLENIRSVVPTGASAELTAILESFPIAQGPAELVAYLALEEDDVQIVMDDHETVIVDVDDVDSARRVRLPKTTVVRR